MSHPERKKTYVDSKVQGALVRRLVFHWLAFLTVASAIAFCLQVLSNPFRPINEHVWNMWWTHGPFILVMVFMLPIFVLDAIKLSHRFVGPIYRLKQEIRSIADGKPIKPLKFRDFDFWKGLAEDFNAMIQRLTNGESSGTDHHESSEDVELTHSVND